MGDTIEQRCGTCAYFEDRFIHYVAGDDTQWCKKLSRLVRPVHGRRCETFRPCSDVAKKPDDAEEGKDAS